MSPEAKTAHWGARQALSKVPAVTVHFWIIKILCTTVGETAADFLSSTLNLGLTTTTYVMAALLAVFLVFQFRAGTYRPWLYWLTVVLISVVGTLITDNLTDGLEVPLETTTVVFALALIATFAAWYARERTLSIHTISTMRRESFYWLAILFTFALGTASGDLVAERLNMGYLPSAVMFGALIGVIALAYGVMKVNAVLTFWLAYILTRPLGASLGDYLSQPGDEGGLGLGTVVTSALFLIAIVGFVVYLTISGRDRDLRGAALPAHGRTASVGRARRAADGRDHRR
ncbi:membrane protein [Planotetraspora silvatica]|uniref:Membrane protein n=2 Tax=Planotetraspora silvatica TaxID=234614 RepID=A0A8J3ULM6_9ACTN|nr:membrane protein [Planotetraspora silvatica]